MRPEPKYPKSYPLEHLIGSCCPDGIMSVAQGVVETLEALTREFQRDADAARTPSIADHPRIEDHGVEGMNVLARVDGGDFRDFHAHVAEAAGIARRAFDSPSKSVGQAAWSELFGHPFPNDGDDDDDDGPDGNGMPDGGGKSGAAMGGFTPRTKKTEVEGGRYALA